jgi:hypothetical protein
MRPTYGTQTNYTAQPFDFYREVRSKCAVEKLLRYGLNVQSAQQANLQLADFQEAGYSLAELARMFPSFEQLQQLQLNKHLFGQRWGLQHLSAYYKVPAAQLCSVLDLRSSDFLQSRIKAVELVQAAFTWEQLREMGADFQFILESSMTPEHFAALGGRIQDVQDLNLSFDQKSRLSVNSWNTFSIPVIPGITATNAARVWMSLDKQFR